MLSITTISHVLLIEIIHILDASLDLSISKDHVITFCESWFITSSLYQFIFKNLPRSQRFYNLSLMTEFFIYASAEYYVSKIENNDYNVSNTVI